MNHYVLTGATGVVGAAVLRQLRTTDCRIYLPVRAGSEQELARRASHLAAVTDPGPDRDHSPARGRIIPVRADLTAPDLGMAGNSRTMLADTATHIIHCAGNVRMNRPLDMARQETLAMTRNIVGLMEEAPRIKKMEYVSTVGVAGHCPGPLSEDWTESPGGYRNTYEAAKALAETYIREKQDQGLNITIHRPSMVVGDSRTGQVIRFQVFYHLCELLSGRLTRGWVPDLSGFHLDIVPSDYVARLLVLSSQTARGLPRIMHACSGKAGSIDLARLTRLVREKFSDRGIPLPRLKRLPVRAYALLARTLKLASPGPAARRLATLPHFLAYLKTPQWFDNRQTLEAIAGHGMVLPDHRRYLGQVMDYYLDQRRL